MASPLPSPLLVRAALLVVGFALLRGLFFALVIPPFHAPDEPVHLDYAEHLVESRTLPGRAPGCPQQSEEIRAAVRALLLPTFFKPGQPFPDLATFAPPDPRDDLSRATTGCGAAAVYPPLYYATVALPLKSLQKQPLLTRLFAARLVSVLWGCAAALFAFCAGLFFFDSVRDATLLGLVCACQPMLGMLFSSVNNDAALFALSAGALAAIAAAFCYEGPLPLAALGAFGVAGALVKPTFALMLPGFFLLAVFALGRRRLLSWLRAGVALLPAAATTLLWQLSLGEGAPAAVRAVTPGAYLSRFVFAPGRAWHLWQEMYWMGWGWVDTWLAPRWYVLLAALLLFAAANAVASWRALAAEARGLLAVGFVATLTTVTALYWLEYTLARSATDEFLQGRYLLGLFPLHAAMLMVALRAPALSPSAPRAPATPFPGTRGLRIDPAACLLLFLAAMDSASVLRALARYHG